ncbi:MAG: hypothetical protein ACI4QN_02300 [Candidatus Coproplasma sp.]
MEDILLALSSLLYSAGTDGYKIFYEDELTEVFPEDLRNRETLEAALKKLVSDGCVDVKYVRGEVFCIAVLKKYEPPKELENQDEEDSERCENGEQKLSVKKVYVCAAVAAFLGGMLGGCVTAIIAAVV